MLHFLSIIGAVLIANLISVLVGAVLLALAQSSQDAAAEEPPHRRRP